MSPSQVVESVLAGGGGLVPGCPVIFLPLWSLAALPSHAQASAPRRHAELPAKAALKNGSVGFAVR